MGDPKLQLYVDSQFASPYALSAFVCLHEKQLPFSIIPLDLAARQHHQLSFAAMSVTRRVPTLVHDGFTLSESSAISEYLQEVFPGTPLYPTEVRHRARARQIQAWLRSDLLPIRQERPTEVVFFGRKGGPLSREARECAEWLFAAVDSLLPAGATNLFGDWCIADVDLAVMLNRLILNDDAVPPRLADYARLQWQRPSLRLWVNYKRPALSPTNP